MFIKLLWFRFRALSAWFVIVVEGSVSVVYRYISFLLCSIEKDAARMNVCCLVNWPKHHIFDMKSFYTVTAELGSMGMGT